MRFSDVFASSSAPTQLGNVRLRYQGTLLIGERVKPLRSAGPSGWWAGALACAAGAMAAALLPSHGAETLHAMAAGALLAAATGLLAVSVWTERRDRLPNRFVLNFDTVTLRWEQPTRFGRPRAELFAFDQVRDVEAIQLGRPARGWALAVRVRTPRSDERSLIFASDVLESERAQLERFARVLRGAFGLGEPRPPGGTSPSVAPDTANETRS